MPYLILKHEKGMDDEEYRSEIFLTYLIRPDFLAREANFSQVCTSSCLGKTSDLTLSKACHTSTLRCTPLSLPLHMLLVSDLLASASDSLSPGQQVS